MEPLSGTLTIPQHERGGGEKRGREHMGTTVVAPEPQCQHLSRTDVGKINSGRQVCDNPSCKQIFQYGFPVTVVPPVAVVPEPVEAALPPITVTEAPTPTVKTTTLSLLPIFTADQPTKLRKADMDVHRARIKSLNPEETLATTIAGFKLLDHATEIGDLYLAACQQHFDNRGQGNRIISGFNGFQDFVERGLGAHIRTIQRRLKKFHDPEAADLKAKDESEKRRLEAAAQKQVVQKARAAAAEPPTSTERDIPEKPAEEEPPEEEPSESPITTKPSTKKSAARSEQVFENDGEYVALTINWIIKLLEPVEKTDPKRYVKLVKLITSRLTEELMEGSDGE